MTEVQNEANVLQSGKRQARHVERSNQMLPKRKLPRQNSKGCPAEGKGTYGKSLVMTHLLIPNQYPKRRLSVGPKEWRTFACMLFSEQKPAPLKQRLPRQKAKASPISASAVELTHPNRPDSSPSTRKALWTPHCHPQAFRQQWLQGPHVFCLARPLPSEHRAED